MRLELLLTLKSDKEPFVFDDYIELEKKIFVIFNDLKINQPHIMLNGKSVLIKIDIRKPMKFQNVKTLDELYLKITKNSSIESIFDVITLYSDSSLYFSRKLHQLVYFSEIEIRKMLCMALAGAIGANWYQLIRNNIETNKQQRKNKILKDATNLENLYFSNYIALFSAEYELDEILNELKKIKNDDDIIKNINNSKKSLILWLVEGLKDDTKGLGQQIKNIKQIRNNVAHNKTIIFDDYEKNQKSLNDFLKDIRKRNKIIETTQFDDFKRDLEKIDFELIAKKLDELMKKIFNLSNA